MGISIIKKNIEEKFNPFIDIENFFNRENYEELFIDYYNDFYNKYILSFVGDNLSSSELNRINKEVARLIDKKMLSICRNLLNEYNLSSSDVTSLYERINILKELVLIYSIPNRSLGTIKRIERLADKKIEDNNKETEMLYFINLIFDIIFKKYNPRKEKYEDDVLLFIEEIDNLMSFVENETTLDRYSSIRRKVFAERDKLIDKYALELGIIDLDNALINDIMNKYSVMDVSLDNVYDFSLVFRNELEGCLYNLELHYGKYIDVMRREAISSLESILEEKLSLIGYSSKEREELEEMLKSFNPSEIYNHILEYRPDYVYMSEEEKIIVEIELYKKYLISFKSKISLYNKKVRVMHSKKWADKYINYVNKLCDDYIKKEASKIGMPISKNPWFIRKYLYADEYNFATLSGTKLRQIIGPVLRKIISFTTNNKFVVESRAKLDSSDNYIYVSTHYFIEDVRGMFATLNRQAYMLMGTRDQIENNFELLAAVFTGFFFVEREDNISRKQCLGKQNRIVSELNSSFINYVAGSWENSENELQPLSYSGPYRTAKKTGKKIVPISMHYDKENKTVYFREGTPIDVSKLKEEEANLLIRDTLASMRYKQMVKYGQSMRCEFPYYDSKHELWNDGVLEEYWNGQEWNSPFAYEEIALRSSHMPNILDVYNFIENLSKDRYIELMPVLKEIISLYEELKRFDIKTYIDDNYLRMVKRKKK